MCLSCPVCHYSLTAEHSKSPEAIQRRACQIIVGGGKYRDNCAALNLVSLSERRPNLSNHHHQQTNIQFFYRLDALPVAQQQCQSTEGK